MMTFNFSSSRFWHFKLRLKAFRKLPWNSDCQTNKRVFSLRQSSVAGDCENDTTRKKLHSARRIQSIETIGRTKGKVFWKLPGIFLSICARRENLPRGREKIGKFLLDHQCWCTRTQRAALSSMKIYYLCVSSFLCEKYFFFFRLAVGEMEKRWNR